MQPGRFVFGKEKGATVMANFCTNCGHGRKETDKFCAECGTAVGGGGAKAHAVQHGHWECQTFTESLAGAGFKGIDWPSAGCAPGAKPRGGIASHIERIVDELVTCAAKDGWEPDESLSADSLLRNQCVQWRSAQPLPVRYTEVDVISVSVRFKRWVIS